MLTEKHRGWIDQELCAEGLHRILNDRYREMSYKEKAILHGAISLLYDCTWEEWYGKKTEKYDCWDPFDDDELSEIRHGTEGT